MYAIKFTRAAFTDLTWRAFTDEELDAIESELRRIARLNNVRLDVAVMTVAQTNYEWCRLKITQPRQIRVFFTIDDVNGYLVVRLVMYRGDRTYDIAQIKWEVQKAA